jgi:molybdate transport system ATP-binding protein
VTGGLFAEVEVARPGGVIAARLEVPPGRVLGLVGPNGAGKSSILAAIAGVAEATGVVRIGDRVVSSLPPERRRVGLVFQDLLLFAHLDVRDNVAFAARARGLGRAASRAAAQPWLDRFDLADLATRRPDQLSGGQRQRVALARALAAEPDVLLLDEPTASLDVEVRDAVRADLARHLRAFGGAAVVVSHDPADAAALADDLVVLERGAVVQRGTLADLAAHPASAWVARFASLAG